LLHPGILLARIEAERQGGIEGEGRILADIEIARPMTAFDPAILYGIEHFQAGDKLARAERINLEFAVAEGGDAIRK
jgi:hypothetical protein